MKILLVGEGPGELGGRSGEKAYQTDSPGVLEALLKKVQSSGWEIADSIQWMYIRKYKAGGFRSAEQRNVKGLYNLAKEKGYDALAFARDRDGDKQRQELIEGAIAELLKEHPQGPGIIGGMVVEKLEAWILALAGKNKSENTKHPEKRLGEITLEPMTLSQMLAVVAETDLSKIPKDAQSLNTWLERARAVLGSSEPSSGRG